MKTQTKILMRIMLLAIFCLFITRCSTEQLNLESDLQDNALNAKTNSDKWAKVKFNLTAHLNGSNEVPSNDSKATGEMIIKISKDETMVHYKLNVANIENISQSHLHVIPPDGNSGPPRIWILRSSEAPTGRFNGTLKEGYIMPEDFFINNNTGEPHISMSELIWLLRNGKVYINVHTAQYGGGEIRGDF